MEYPYVDPIISVSRLSSGKRASSVDSNLSFALERSKEYKNLFICQDEWKFTEVVNFLKEIWFDKHNFSVQVRLAKVNMLSGANDNASFVEI